MEQEPVRREDIRKRLTPVLQPFAVEPPTVRWTDEDWQRIRLGARAQSMDERWHLFVEDGTLFFHRSWTGHGIFEAVFDRAEDGWRIVRLTVCGDRGQYRRTSDDLDRKTVVAVINGVLLGRWE